MYTKNLFPFILPMLAYYLAGFPDGSFQLNNLPLMSNPNSQATTHKQLLLLYCLLRR
jgi:hypothetical protein